MSTALIVVFTPLQFYILYANVSVPHHEYSWHDVHDDWQINPIPTGGLVLFDRWIRIGIGFLVFAFFGVGEDAIKMYRSWLVKLGLARIFQAWRSRADLQKGPRGPAMRGAVSVKRHGWFSRSAYRRIQQCLQTAHCKYPWLISASSYRDC